MSLKKNNVFGFVLKKNREYADVLQMQDRTVVVYLDN